MYMVVQKAWPFCSTANILKMPALICMILGQLGAFCYQDNNIYFAKGLVHQKGWYTRRAGTPEGLVHQKADTREGLVHQKADTREGLVHQKADTQEGLVHQMV